MAAVVAAAVGFLVAAQVVKEAGVQAAKEVRVL
jgi:hypothetical protein